MTRRSLVPDAEPLVMVSAETERAQTTGAIVATDDPALIREWAQRHSAEPATGEATASGPATIDVHDGGVGIRFNFPAASRFRPISWDEWFDNLHRYQLLFVYERDDVPSGSSRYRLIPKSSVEGSLTTSAAVDARATSESGRGG